MQAHNIGVILTSHDPQQGEFKFTRHIHLYDGRVTPKKGVEQMTISLIS